MKILHKSKRVVPPPVQVTELINKLLAIPDDEISRVLGEIDVWKWPRSDLNAWIKVLNKFDAVLADIIRDYELDALKLRTFPPPIKKKVSEILRFERLLLENSTNRKMFNSYDRINSLLLAEDLDIVTLALKLMLRPSQQYSAQPSVSQALSIPTMRLQALSKRWPHLREYGIALVDLINPQGSAEVESIPPEGREVNFTFYRTNIKSPEDEQKMDTDGPESSPASSRKPSAVASQTSGAVTIHIDDQKLQSQSVADIMRETCEAYQVPDSEKYELLCRIRSAVALGKGHEEEREKLVVIRLLAIAIFGHTHPEAQATSSIFLYEPDLITNIAELLQVDKGVPISVQTAAIAALDALARYRSKIQEVLTSVNAGVNHGILMALLRKTINDIANPDSVIPQSFVEALLAFVTFIASHASGGNMVVGAGLIPLLIQVLENKLPHRLPVLSKAMQLVDNVLYSFTNAFNLFCASRGVEALVDRIAYEIDLDITQYGDVTKSREIYGSVGEIPVTRAAVLKHILRSLHRMMQSSGTSEGLRGLIDTSILQSIKRIIEYRGLFGPSVLPIAINIMATFVHNEPTSLATIQEAGLPEAFYKSIEIGLEPAFEVIQAIPNAIGALCLNEVGQAQLAARPSIIPALFTIFTSERHLKVLLDKENAVLMGTGIDELIRHHPSLKSSVFDSILSCLSKIEDLGNAYEPPHHAKQWYQLLPTASEDGDVTMKDAAVESGESAEQGEEAQAEPPILSSSMEDTSLKRHDNHLVNFIDVIGRFMEGLFQNPTQCRDFILNTDGLTRLGRITALPCLPYDFANSVASDSMVQIMRTMTEVATQETLTHLSNIVNESLATTRDFWQDIKTESKLVQLVEVQTDDAVNVDFTFRNLVSLHIRITLLSDVFATAGYAHGRAAISLLQALMSEASDGIIAKLGCLHRAAILENIALKSALVAKRIDVVQTPAASPLDRSPDHPVLPLPEADGAGAPNGTGDGQTDPSPAPAPSTENSQRPKGPNVHNATALKHVTHGLPSSLAPFFQAMVKMFYSRRTPDAAQKQQVWKCADIVADLMVKHLRQGDFVDTLTECTYQSIMLGLMTILLVDERATTTTLHTVQLTAIYRAGGLDAMFDICRRFMNVIESICEVKEDARTEMQLQELSHAYGGLKVGLHLVYPLISSKPLFESAQTITLSTRDKAETDADFFEPHNFLVRLRVACLPLLRSLWEAQWLVHAPLSVSRSVVQAVLELLNGENEEGRGDADPAPTPFGISRTPASDENRIRQLTDMGFPRSAAERALQRTHNNVSAATELLLAHPFPFPPDPEPEPPASEQNEDNSGEASSDQTGSAPPSDEAGGDHPTTPLGKTMEEWRKELNEAREPLRAGISRQALMLVDEHQPLLFDLHAAFIRPASDHQKRAVQDLVDDIKQFSPSAYDIQEQPLANRCRLLALVLCETPSSLPSELRASLMDSLLALLLSNPVGANTEHPTVPRWLAAHLLVTEALLTLADEPTSISLPKEGEPIEPQPISKENHLSEARTIVFDFCLRLLAIPDLPNDELLSCLRLFVLLTRESDMASQFIKRDGIGMLFSRLKASPVNGSASYIATILRHMVEDKPTVQHIMDQAIKRYFSSPRTRIVDVGNYVRTCSGMALRDPASFIEVTQNLCQLDSSSISTPHITLKSDDGQPEVGTDKPKQPASDMQVDAPSNIPSSTSEAHDTLVHFLVEELMSAVKGVDIRKVAQDFTNRDDQKVDQASQAPNTANAADSGGSPGADTNPKEQTRYACFLMQCLTELLFSYDSCKVAFLTWNPKKASQNPKESQRRYRMYTLVFFLSELIAYGVVTVEANTTHNPRISLCNWAMSVLVALCVDTTSMHESKDVSNELVTVRKHVLDALNRAIKNPRPSDTLEERYGRLLALVDLCHRLLTVRFNTNPRKHVDDSPTNIAKIMLEKNYVATLTAALSEIDLNYPNIRGLVGSVLKPLEALTKIAIKMSRSSAKGKDVVDTARSESESSFSSDEEGEEQAAEEGRGSTPDFYRNSALGMYGGEMEDMNYPRDEDEEMDDIDEEDEEDADVDFAEQTGSEDTTDSERDQDTDDMDDSDPTAHSWHDGEEGDALVADEDEDADENVEGVQEDDEPSEDGDVDEGDDMMWQDIEGERDPEAPDDEGEDDADGGAPIHIIHDGEEEEPEMVSDEDEGGPDLVEGGDFVRDMFGLDDNMRDDFGGIFVPRRRGADDNLQVFGRPRNAPTAPPEATTHPLLLDVSSGNRTTSRSSRDIRQPHRLIAGGNAELLQTIEELVGGSAVQLFHHIMTRGRGGGAPETIRLDVPAGTLASFERGYLQHRRPHGSVSAVRVERSGRQSQNHTAGREIEPLLTLQRWGEEVKIIHGDFVAERAGKLANHVTLTLLPAALEAAKQAKEKEEEEARVREEQVKAEEAAKAAEATKDTPAETEGSPEQPNTEVDAEDAMVEDHPHEPPTADHPMADVGPPAQDLDAEMQDVAQPSNEPEVSASVEQPDPSSVAHEASTSDAAPSRVTVMIHGSPVDITDTGIDPTFLEALPDDMREEVLNQHVRDQRAARVERPADSQISAEFLDALPPEIRAEIIQQEAIERSRRRTEDSTGQSAAPADMDPASFIASLDPTLRQAVLMEQDEGFIQSLPSHMTNMLAGADSYPRGVRSISSRPFGARTNPSSRPAGSSRKFTPQHDAIQLLDKQGVASLIRLLFFPNVLRKTLLFKVLLHLCENAKTRTDLFNLLLNILQDGTGDLANVDKSFSQLSMHGPKQPKSPGKQKAPEYFASVSLPNPHNETVPDLIAQRSLEALTYIVTSNQMSSLFFLTEHEVPAGLKKTPSRKGKGKEKQAPQTHYPIVLLLGLLDRHSLLRTPSIMESFVGLLATVTRPLTSLKESKPQVAESSKSSAPEPQPSENQTITQPADNAPTGETSSSGQGSEQPTASGTSGAEGPNENSGGEASAKIEAVEEKILLANPPQIPHPVLRLIVNILTVGECSSRTFQQSLSLIQHLSYLPDARDVIAQELRSKAQEFGQELYTELDELAGALQNSEGDVLVSSVASKFSAPSSVQAKLLRVLKTIDYMYTPRSSGSPISEGEVDSEKVQAIYESFRFAPLWKRLGDCLAIIEDKPDTEHVATVLLPLIEALMVVCKYVGTKTPGGGPSRAALRASMSPRSPTTPRETMEDLFVTFTDAHRKVLNLMVRNNPSLMSGSFSLLVHNPRVLDFDNKRNYFSQQLHKRPHGREHYGTIQLNVRRARVFEDSFQHLQRRTGEQIKYGKLSIRFYDEEGVDAGGLTREWFQILARQMFDPNNALFQPCAADKLTYQPNKNSWVNPEHLSFFKFVGRVIGKAIYDGRLLDAYFARSLYRQLLGKPVDYRDVEWVDPEYYNSLCWILENDPTPLDLTFSVEADEFGVNRIVPLKENGESIPVTLENRREFVQLSAQYRLYSSIKDQIESLLAGFYEIIPKDLVTIFNEQELELLISGTPDIDVDEWRAATEYNGYTSSDPNIVWWWRALKSFTRDEKAKVLSFATGTSRVPLNGFVDLQGVQGVQRFSIHRAYGEPDRLPQAHTCFNQIDLPQYSSYEMLRQQLLLAINEGAEGFGFV